MADTEKEYDPDLDGVDHINVYSRARTELGRLLSNFAHTPIHLKTDGYFASIEAYWYWLAIDGLRDDPKYKWLRSLHGFKCKEMGRKALQELATKNGGSNPLIPDFESKIKKALLTKIEQTDGLADLLKKSTLPLVHYYFWGNQKPYKVSVPEKYQWITDYISDVRDYLNGKAEKLIVAGSRKIRDFELVEKSFIEHCKAHKVIEIVSGLAPGPDLLGVEIAKKYHLPWEEFPADWDGPHKKAAGFVRNALMADYATSALIHWDGKSNGTRNIIGQMERRLKPYKLYVEGADGNISIKGPIQNLGLSIDDINVTSVERF